MHSPLSWQLNLKVPWCLSIIIFVADHSTRLRSKTAWNQILVLILTRLEMRKLSNLMPQKKKNSTTSKCLGEYLCERVHEKLLERGWHIMIWQSMVSCCAGDFYFNSYSSSNYHPPPMPIVVLQSLSCPTPCNPKDCSTPGLPVHHQLLELAQTHVHWVCDAI